jgi:hypothetical protein
MLDLILENCNVKEMQLGIFLAQSIVFQEALFYIFI